MTKWKRPPPGSHHNHPLHIYFPAVMLRVNPGQDSLLATLFKPRNNSVVHWKSAQVWSVACVFTDSLTSCVPLASCTTFLGLHLPGSQFSY